jgi:hypothetical protein
MIGAIEILLIAIIFGIIYGKDAIDDTFKKRPDENIVESFADDIKEFYDEDPQRLIKLGIFAISLVSFVGVAIYWVLTRTSFPKMMAALFQ